MEKERGERDKGVKRERGTEIEIKREAERLRERCGWMEG